MKKIFGLTKKRHHTSKTTMTAWILMGAEFDFQTAEGSPRFKHSTCACLSVWSQN